MLAARGSPVGGRLVSREEGDRAVGDLFGRQFPVFAKPQHPVVECTQLHEQRVDTEEPTSVLPLFDDLLIRSARSRRASMPSLRAPVSESISRSVTRSFALTHDLIGPDQLGSGCAISRSRQAPSERFRLAGECRLQLVMSGRDSLDVAGAGFEMARSQSSMTSFRIDDAGGKSPLGRSARDSVDETISTVPKYHWRGRIVILVLRGQRARNSG